jgi:hypothetical protein
MQEKCHVERKVFALTIDIPHEMFEKDIHGWISTNWIDTRNVFYSDYIYINKYIYIYIYPLSCTNYFIF